MHRHAPLLPLFLLVGCAAPRASGLIVGEPTGGRAGAPRTEAPPVEPPAAHDDSAAVLTFPALESEAPSESTISMLSTVTQQQMQQMQPPPRRQQPQFLQRFTLKGGYYGSSEEEFDDGYNITASWMRFTSPVFASEVEIGYLDASGTHLGVDRDVWSVPLIANGRLNLPVGEKIEIYGGVGLGTFYYEADAKAPGVKVSADGFLFGGDAYFGGTIHLGETLFLGVESKYYLTDNDSELGGSLDAYVLMLTLGFGR